MPTSLLADYTKSIATAGGGATKTSALKALFQPGES
jgi:hypothetical protein